MIETSQRVIDSLRGDQTVSARISILSEKTPSIKFLCDDIDDILISNKLVEDLGYKDGQYSKQAYNMPQMHNIVTYETGKYAIFEGDGIDLDGSVKVISKSNKSNQFGLYSKRLSDENGYCNHIFEWYHQHFRQSNLNIVFSKVREEYAIDFDVIISYEVEGEMEELGFREVQKTYNVTNNTDTVYIINDIEAYDFGTVTIKIKKWSKKYSRLKIIQIYYGDLLEYGDEDIISLNVAKGTDLLNNSVESKEINLTIKDENEEYNIFDPQGELANLNKGSILSLELGCVMDEFTYYVKMDEFILEKPKKEQNTLEVSVSGYGILKLLGESDFTANYYEKLSAQMLLDSLYGYSTELDISLSSEIKKENTQIRSQYGTVKVPERNKKSSNGSMRKCYRDDK